MDIKYDIVGFKKSLGELQIRYYNEDLPEGMTFAITLPVIERRYPEGVALDVLIRNQAPKDIFERAHADRQSGAGSIATQVSPFAASNSAIFDFGEGMHFVREGKDRIFLISAVPKSRVPDIPVEVW